MAILVCLESEDEEEDEGWHGFGHLFGATPLIEGREGKNLESSIFIWGGNNRRKACFIFVYHNLTHAQ